MKTHKRLHSCTECKFVRAIDVEYDVCGKGVWFGGTAKQWYYVNTCKHFKSNTTTNNLIKNILSYFSIKWSLNNKPTPLEILLNSESKESSKKDKTMFDRIVDSVFNKPPLDNWKTTDPLNKDKGTDSSLK